MAQDQDNIEEGYKEGRITISRTSSNNRPDFVMIELKHKDERRTSTTIELSIEDYGLLISGQGHIPCNHKTQKYA